jgi:hypothetical protein
VTQPTALVAIGDDDVYEDLFTASRKLADITVGEGLVTRAVLGTERPGTGSSAPPTGGRSRSSEAGTPRMGLHRTRAGSPC